MIRTAAANPRLQGVRNYITVCLGEARRKFWFREPKSSPISIISVRALKGHNLETSPGRRTETFKGGTKMPNQLLANQQLNINDHLDPSDNECHLIMQSDGNLVLYRNDNGRALWASNTWGKPVNHAIMQTDGNFVCYDAGGHPYWATGTDGHPGSSVILQDDGNLVVYSSAHVALWASGTVQTWNSGVAPQFPIQMSQTNSFSGSGGSMATTVTVYASGLLNAVTHTWEVTDLRGFRGAVAVAVLDENKANLWVSPTQQYGVDGRWIGTSDRTDNWSASIPAPILPNIRYLAIIQQWNPNNVFNDIETWLKGIANIGTQLASIIQSVKTVAAVL